MTRTTATTGNRATAKKTSHVAFHAVSVTAHLFCNIASGTLNGYMGQSASVKQEAFRNIYYDYLEACPNSSKCIYLALQMRIRTAGT